MRFLIIAQEVKSAGKIQQAGQQGTIARVLNVFTDADPELWLKDQIEKSPESRFSIMNVIPLPDLKKDDGKKMPF